VLADNVLEKLVTPVFEKSGLVKWVAEAMHITLRLIFCAVSKKA